MAMEMKWDFAILNSTKPKSYSTDLRRHIPPLAHPDLTPTISSNSASTTSNSISSTSTSSTSGSAHNSKPLADQVGNIEPNEVLWIWWFDRQGTIQSTEIHFVEDLPRFLVFLVAIQRFSLSDWGFDLELDLSIPQRHLPLRSDGTQHGSTMAELDINDHFKITYSTKMTKLIHDVFCICGQSTIVFNVESSTKQLPLVAKLSWPNKDQLDEAAIIKHACESTPHLHNHLPHVFGSRDIDPIGTGHIREELGISSNSPSSPCVLHITVFERLFPITELSGNSLLEAWVIMLSGTAAKVMNDWDLAHAEGKSEPRADVIGTLPFMAIHLMSTIESGGEIKRIYYYDLESFMWILLWIFFGELKNIDSDRALAEWRSSKRGTSYLARCGLLCHPIFTDMLEDWKDWSPLARALVAWVQSHYATPDMNETEEKNKELLKGLLKIVGESWDSGMPNTPMIDRL
ncbi:hypothetical protein FRC11_008962 [Ceratobasidium sp. 423]|nr:hypothetical protein FRC11_008962 [Ceratobasidium sp. 423]